jgi:hypothetical protein
VSSAELTWAGRAIGPDFAQILSRHAIDINILKSVLQKCYLCYAQIHREANRRLEVLPPSGSNRAVPSRPPRVTPPPDPSPPSGCR